MRIILRILGGAALGILLVGIAIASSIFAVHGAQLHRLARLSQKLPQSYLSETAPYYVLTNGNVIDGTGAEEKKGESIVVRDGRIVWIGQTSTMPTQLGAKVIDLHGDTVLPGFVMLHEHLFTSSLGNRLSQQSVTFPLLYLAGGVTTARTAGSIDPQSDLKIKKK